MLESEFKKNFKRRLLKRMDALGESIEIIENKSQRRSTPDTFIFGRHGWAALEFKRAANADQQPNQAHYITRFGELGYARFIFPECAEEALDELEELFAPIG